MSQAAKQNTVLATGSGYGTIPGITLAGAAGGLGLSEDYAQLGARGLNIRVLPANGGTIISIKDENNYHSQSDLYVVGDTQDIGQELGKIITMHYLKKDNEK